MKMETPVLAPIAGRLQPIAGAGAEIGAGELIGRIERAADAP